MFKMLKPLISNQKYINNFQIFNDESIDVNFDLIRELPINLLFDNTRYATLLTGVHPDLYSEFLSADNHKDINEAMSCQKELKISKSIHRL